METVNFDLINRIRKHINRTKKQSEILPFRLRWNKLTSALNVLEDTSWAVEYYLEADYPKDVKGKYLFLYGLLQALYVQQDAVRSIYFGLFDKELKKGISSHIQKALKVRNLRNDTIGHPTDLGESTKKELDLKQVYSISIAQFSMTKESFYYCKYNAKDRSNDSIENVNVMQAIEDNAKCINDILQRVVNDLDKEFKEYIEKHRDRKMADIFNTLHYAEEKALLDDVMQSWGYNATKEMVTKCEEELVKRYGSVDTVDSFKYLLEEIHELYSLIDNIYNISTENQDRLWHYLVELLFVKLHELEDCCKETDEYFENYGETIIDSDNDSEGVTLNIVFPDGSKVDEEIMK